MNDYVRVPSDSDPTRERRFREVSAEICIVWYAILTKDENNMEYFGISQNHVESFGHFGHVDQTHREVECV